MLLDMSKNSKIFLFFYLCSRINIKIINKARVELRNKIKRGYTNINLGFIEEEVDKMLVELKVG